MTNGKWKKTNKVVTDESTTIRYERVGSHYAIESRKRHIPHANGIGSWEHTSYFVVRNGKDIAEKWTLKDAKEYVDEQPNA